MNSYTPKAQSAIVSSVLLILLVVVLTFIIIGFVVPFVKNQLAGTDCFSAVDVVSITNSDQYTCYTANEMRVQVHVSEAELISGFSIEMGGASTKAYAITNGSANAQVKMFGGDYNQPLQLPGKNEERTYVIPSPTIPDSLRVYPRLKDGRMCDSFEEVNTIVPCP